MVLNKGVKLCFGLLLVCCIMFIASSNVFSENVSALALNTSNVNFNYQEVPNTDYYWSSNKNLSSNGVCGSDCYIKPVYHARYLQFNYANTSFSGNHATIHFEANVVWSDNSQLTPEWVNLDRMTITSCLVGSTALTIESQNLSYATTPWMFDSNLNKYTRSTLTIYGDVVLSNIPNGSGSIKCNFGSASFAYFTGGSYLNNLLYVEKNVASIIFTNNLNDALLQQQVAQNEVMIQNQEAMLELQQQTNNLLGNQISQDNQAYDNISGQSPSDIQGAENQQTSNIIGIISRFFGQLGNISPQSCDLTLPFPQYAGGTVTVTPCNGKQYLPNNGLFIQITASLFLVGFTIPLCFILLKMIYNEIRSWTNG